MATSGAEITVTPTREPERPAIENLLRRCGVFREEEVAVALEVLDVYLYRLNQQDYQVFTAKRGGAVAGYVCFGPNAMTDGTFELYWIAVDPAQHRNGVGRSLMTLAEYEIARQGGRLISVETSSREDYHATRKFYHGLGYRQAASVTDYYAVGDSKIILTKKLPRRMRIGIAYNLRDEVPDVPGAPVDHAEEFDSPATIDALAQVLGAAGHTVERLGFGRGFLRQMLDNPPDLVFNIAEGLAGRSREAQVPAVCEMLGVPCTGSDPLTLALTLDKDLAKRVVASRGLATPKHLLVERLAELPGGDTPGGLAFPLIVKPAWEGSSKGVRLASRVTTPAALAEQVAFVLGGYGGPALVEEFCEGEEFTVGVIGNEAPRVIGVMQIRHRSLPSDQFLYSLEVKRDWENQVEYLVPPPVASRLLADLEALALGCYRALGCRDVSRVDLRLRAGVPHFIEVNPLPGLSPTYGDLPILAGRVGWSYPELVLAIVEHALARTVHAPR